VDASILVVNWNSRELLATCLASVFRETRGIAFEVVVVDSGSFDGCGDLLGVRFPQVRFVQSERNVGFGRANNLAAVRATGDVLIILNPDTVVRGNAIGELCRQVRTLDRPGIVGCRMLNGDGSVQATCVQPMPTIVNRVVNARVLLTWSRGRGPWTSALAFEGSVTPQPVACIAGACMAVRREVFFAVGGFSPEYFMYAEDLDLCHKVRGMGLVNYFVPSVEVVHAGGGSSRHQRDGFHAVMMRESIARLLRKIRGPRYALAYRLAITGAAAARIALLAVAIPGWARPGRASRGRASMRKWIAVLRWGLGLERWIRRYDNVQSIKLGPHAGEAP
jgi:GT2 family glycosyltransferase